MAGRHAARSSPVRDTNAGLVAPGVRIPAAAVRYPRRCPRGAHPAAAALAIAGPTVTITVLAAVPTGLLGLLAGMWTRRRSLMAKQVPRSYNHFGNVVVGLYHPQLEPDERVRRIATDLANAPPSL